MPASHVIGKVGNGKVLSDLNYSIKVPGFCV